MKRKKAGESDPGQVSQLQPDAFIAGIIRDRERLEKIQAAVEPETMAVLRRIVTMPVGGQWLVNYEDKEIGDMHEDYRKRMMALIEDLSRKTNERMGLMQEVRFHRSLQILSYLTIRNIAKRDIMLATTLFGDIFGDLTSGTLSMMNVCRISASLDNRGILDFADWNGNFPYDTPASEETMASPDNIGFDQFSAVVSCMMSHRMVPKLEYRENMGAHAMRRGLYLFGRHPSRIGSNLCLMDVNVMSVEMRGILDNCARNGVWTDHDTTHVNDLYYSGMMSDIVKEIYIIMHPFVALRMLASIVWYIRYGMAAQGADVEIASAKLMVTFCKDIISRIPTFFYDAGAWIERHEEVFYKMGTWEERDRVVSEALEIPRRSCLVHVLDKYFSSEPESAAPLYCSGVMLRKSTPFGFVDVR